jgi:hypothetical protein
MAAHPALGLVLRFVRAKPGLTVVGAADVRHSPMTPGAEPTPGAIRCAPTGPAWTSFCVCRGAFRVAVGMLGAGPGTGPLARRPGDRCVVHGGPGPLAVPGTGPGPPGVMAADRQRARRGTDDRLGTGPAGEGQGERWRWYGKIKSHFTRVGSTRCFGRNREARRS